MEFPCWKVHETKTKDNTGLQKTVSSCECVVIGTCCAKPNTLDLLGSSMAPPPKKKSVRKGKTPLGKPRRPTGDVDKSQSSRQPKDPHHLRSELDKTEFDYTPENKHGT